MVNLRSMIARASCSFIPGCPSVRFTLEFVRTTGGGNVHEALCIHGPILFSAS